MKITVRSMAGMVTLATALSGLTGCSTMPNLIQHHGNTYSLNLPSGQQIIDNLTYNKVCNVPLAVGVVTVMEKPGGDVRLAYPNGNYSSIQGWSDLHLLNTKPDGDRTIALFSGDHNGERGAEMIAIVYPNRVQWAKIASPGDEYRVRSAQGNRIDLEQTATINPMVRTMDLGMGSLSAPYYPRTATASRHATSSSRTKAITGQQRAESQPRESKPAVDNGVIEIIKTSMPVTAKVAPGYQRAAPQQVDLR